MGRGVSCGGGQSSLGYLFGGGAEAAANNTRPLDRSVSTNSIPIEMQPAAGMPSKRDGVVAKAQVPAANKSTNTTPSTPNKTTSPATKPIDKNSPAGIHSSPTNNYLRLDGQNCGNFITDRPSTKVHSAPGGGSSLGYLFGGNGGK